MKKRIKSHVVTNALLRIENTTGEPPLPFEKPNDTMDFWVLELSWDPEPLEAWQLRVEPILLSQLRRVRRWARSGAKCFLHVQTSHPIPTYPALFMPTFLTALLKLNCTLEHGVDNE